MKSINFLQREKNIGWLGLLLGVQHLLAMFGATTLVPLLTGFSVPVALFAAGVGTLLFHLVTKGQVPVFLGSSFAFIPAIVLVGSTYGLPYAQGGIMVAGLLYLIFAAIVYKTGSEKISKIFPPHVVGSMICIIGITLMPVAFDMAGAKWSISLSTLAVGAIISLFAPGFGKQLAIIAAITFGYLMSMKGGMVDFTPIISANLIQTPAFTSPQFNLGAIMLIAPIVLATFMEHIGDIAANQETVGKNFLKDPGLHRTLIGDGIATAFAGFIGGPANTTYSENTGVLALTKNYEPGVLRVAAWLAIILSFSGKLSAIFASIPIAVIGGVSIMLFGMIAKIGLKTFYTDLLKNVDPIQKAAKSIIFAIMLYIGMQSGATILGLTFSPMAVAAFVGIILDTIRKGVLKWISSKEMVQ